MTFDPMTSEVSYYYIIASENFHHMTSKVACICNTLRDTISFHKNMRANFYQKSCINSEVWELHFHVYRQTRWSQCTPSLTLLCRKYNYIITTVRIVLIFVKMNSSSLKFKCFKLEIKENLHRKKVEFLTLQNCQCTNLDIMKA